MYVVFLREHVVVTIIKNDNQIQSMRMAGKVVADTLKKL